MQDNGGTANGGVDLDPTPNTITINVTPVNDAPTVANAIADQNATQGSAFSFQFAANTFNDVDVGDTLTYTATLSNECAAAGLAVVQRGRRGRSRARRGLATLAPSR